MLFAIFGEDAPDSLPKRRQSRAEHLQRLESLRSDGRLVIAGPHPAVACEDPGEAGFSGSLIIAEFASFAEAQTWAQNDPYVKTGVFARISVKPFRKVLP